MSSLYPYRTTVVDSSVLENGLENVSTIGYTFVCYFSDLLKQRSQMEPVKRDTSPHFSHLIVARGWRWLWIPGARGHPLAGRTVRTDHCADAVEGV